MELILQVHTCGYGGRAGQVPTRDISQHLASLKEGMDAARGMGAALANVHSGHDSWGVEEGRKYMLEAANIEAASGILLSHETHRKRLMWNPWNFRDLMLALEGEPVKITADISHWVVCCERIFDAEYDPDWPEILGLVARHAALVHARVGYCEGPQVPDPRAPEYAGELEAHEGWWDEILESMLERGVAPALEPEHGPPPYQQCTPSSWDGLPMPLADLYDVNSFVGERQAARYRAAHGG